MTPRPAKNRSLPGPLLSALIICALCGCGTTISRSATEQLLSSDAVDRSIAALDFRHFAGEKVYLDTQYLQRANGVGVVNSDYVISSLRQQMLAARCLLQEKKEEAEYIVEARIGALGTNSHEVTYGIPANNLLSTASSLVPMAPPVPTMPEISVAKRQDQLAAAKVSVFAYHRETREPVWQSGVSVARSKAKDTWVLGAGPFQQGEIYQGTQFAGQRLGIPLLSPWSQPTEDPIVGYHDEKFFSPVPPQPPPDEARVAQDDAPPAAGETKEEPAAAVQASKHEATPTKVEPAAHQRSSGRPQEAETAPPDTEGWKERRAQAAPPPAEPQTLDGAADESAMRIGPDEVEPDRPESGSVEAVQPGVQHPRPSGPGRPVHWTDRLRRWFWPFAGGSRTQPAPAGSVILEPDDTADPHLRQE